MKDWNYENEQWTKLPPHLRHLPLFTRYFDLMSMCIRFLWFLFLKFIFFRFYIRLKVHGNMKQVHEDHPRLIVISNHSSHLDAISISTSIPFRRWIHLYFAAAKDYFFANGWMTFFSQHCIGAIPIDRKDRSGEAAKLCIQLLTDLKKIWLVMFPEGTRSKDGLIHPFKKGISVFAERSQTPILFLYLDGAYNLWPKENGFAKPGKLTVYVGPVHPPGPIQEIEEKYRRWVSQFKPEQAFVHWRGKSSTESTSDQQNTDPLGPSSFQD